MLNLEKININDKIVFCDFIGVKYYCGGSLLIIQ